MKIALLPLMALVVGTATPPPEAPDYGDPASWAARADDEGAAGHSVPGSSPRRTVRDADVFYIHPTTDRSRSQDNTSVQDTTVNAWTDASVMARQASAFNRCCRVFAPRYRQATLGANYRGGAIRKVAFDLAYGDVLRAFDHYMAHENGGRPIILAGHSQGAAHLERLLADRIDGRAAQQQLVAAYIVGIGLTEEQLGRSIRSLPVCTSPRQTGCIVHWDTMLADAGKSYAVRLDDQTGERMLCINPLTFDARRPSAGHRASKGAVPGEPDAKPPRMLRRHATDARCEEGLLIVDPRPGLGLAPMPGGSMHYHDIGLFYEDVRQNADTRTQAFLERRGR